MPRRVLVALAVVGAPAAPTFGWAAAPSLVKVLARPIASARRHGLKVLVPSTIAGHAAHLHGSGGASAKVRLASAPGCDGGDACDVAEFLAAPGDPIAGAAVVLARGRTGRDEASRCGASCNPARIQWREYGLNHTIEYIGTRRQLIALAGAAIDAGPR